MSNIRTALQLNTYNVLELVKAVAEAGGHPCIFTDELTLKELMAILAQNSIKLTAVHMKGNKDE